MAVTGQELRDRLLAKRQIDCMQSAVAMSPVEDTLDGREPGSLAAAQEALVAEALTIVGVHDGLERKIQGL